MGVVQREWVHIDLWNSKCIENEVKEEQVYDFNVTLAEDPISKILIEFRFSIISLSACHMKRAWLKSTAFPFWQNCNSRWTKDRTVIKPIKPSFVTLCSLFLFCLKEKEQPPNYTLIQMKWTKRLFFVHLLMF